MSEYVLKTKWYQCVNGIVLGAALLFVGIDMRFTHIIPGSAIESEAGLWAIFAVFGGLGLIFIHGSIKEFFRPTTFFKADVSGVTLYSGGTSKVWNPKTKTWDTTRSKNDSRTIPWESVASIGEGTIYEASSTQWEYKVSVGSTTVGKRRMLKKKALQILVDPEIKLRGFRMGRFSRAWDGYTEEDIKMLPKEDREVLQPEDVHSGYMVRKEYLNGSLEDTILVLNAMKDEA